MKHFFCILLSLCISSTSLQAQLISTEQLVSELGQQEKREVIYNLLSRQEVQVEMKRQGIDPGEASARVAMMSDDEVNRIHNHIADLPAGQLLGDLIAVGLIVFLVLLFTDIMGFTDVFTFVKKRA